MVRVNLETLVMGNAPGASVVILRPIEGDEYDCVLPICIGSFEAAAIGKGVSGEKSSRPMTHALINNMVTQLGGRITRVVIDKVRGTVFYATICIQRGTEVIKIDARPSDAIAIAVRTKVPIYVEDDVLAAASFPSWVNMPKEQQEAQAQEFHAFVEELKPEDFLM